MELVRCIAQIIQYRSGSHCGESPVGMNCLDLVHVLGHIQDHRHVATLTGEGSAASTTQHGCIKAATNCDCLHNVFRIFGNYNANGALPVIGTIGRVKSTAPCIKAHFSPNGSAKLSF